MSVVFIAGFVGEELMFQGRVIRSAEIVDVSPEVAGPDALARGLAFGLPISLGMWVALTLLIF
jgi:hypothetical protein